MKELVEFVAKSVVNEPEAVKVTEREEDGIRIFQLEVAPDDKGRVIGRQGRVAEAIRVLLRVAAVKNDTRAVLEII